MSHQDTRFVPQGLHDTLDVPHQHLQLIIVTALRIIAALRLPQPCQGFSPKGCSQPGGQLSGREDDSSGSGLVSLHCEVNAKRRVGSDESLCKRDMLSLQSMLLFSSHKIAGQQ